MGYSGPFTVASRDIVFESFDGDSVVLDLATGKYFGFSDSGSIVWEALSASVPLEQVMSCISASTLISAADIEKFVSHLVGFNLLSEAPQMMAGTLRADFAARIALATDPLNVDVYDDLADLVLVDPIHDVDEPAGWPAVKRAS